MVHANELMLGDWVNYIGAYKDDSGEIVKLWESPVPIKVTFITPDAVQYEDEEGCYECADYELHPIPLTPEILEKNGFTQCEPQGYDLYVKDKEGAGLYHILWQSEPYNYLEIAAYTYAFGEFNKSNIRYVHQLQHALRLVGIEKEIKIIK